MELSDLKTMLQIADDKRDSILELIKKNTEQALRFKLGLKPSDDLPTELDYITLEVGIKRYNRIANEGMSQYSQEGETITFKLNDFDEFADDIDQWKNNNDKKPKSLGGVAFINPYGGGQHEI
ncbi:hypothetical protein LPAF129_04120 [Ligilactobacillus pabuli]|uniref:Phage protein n=1 Tax=Ligilactobacillus pabuli TaxID=2886039 RepID=A0ABQ5JFD6_9LACO|nr:phage head-tail connector protein [Ligilactobacillus pabuli]GKS80727.1 hypothetical protein LPAF129_04120 [Ligilactobacillus pabuli]